MRIDEPRKAFFAADGNAFVPNEVCRGFWQHDSLHGRAMVGLLGREVVRREAREGVIPVRMTVDLFRMAPFAPVTVETRMLRSGGKLGLAEAILLSGGIEYARATCQFLAPTDPPKEDAWSPGPWDAPHPDAIPDAGRGSHLSEDRMIEGSWGSPWPRRVWTREKCDLIEGEALTAWTRLALAADFASPWAHSVPAGIRYINTDISTSIHRLPVGEWLGFEVTGHDASQGIAVGHCRIHDVEGPIGFITASALAMRRRK